MRNERDLRATIRLVLAGESPDPRWARLIEAFRVEYGMTVVNVTTDDVVVGGSRGRLWLWAADHESAQRFRDETGNYDPVKQDRANELASGGPWFVVCADFSTEALVDFVETGARHLDEARKTLGDDRIWKLNSAFGRVVVFLHTDAERDSLPAEQKAAWEDFLWELFRAANPPGLAKREHFRIEVDSKQTFDEKYQGNSYYYWR